MGGVSGSDTMELDLPIDGEIVGHLNLVPRDVSVQGNGQTQVANAIANPYTTVTDANALQLNVIEMTNLALGMNEDDLKNDQDGAKALKHTRKKKEHVVNFTRTAKMKTLAGMKRDFRKAFKSYSASVRTQIRAYQSQIDENKTKISELEAILCRADAEFRKNMYALSFEQDKLL